MPKSTLHDFSHKLSLVSGADGAIAAAVPRALNRVTYFYIDPRGPLVDLELRFAEIEFKPRPWLSSTVISVGNGAQAQGAGPRTRRRGNVTTWETLGMVMAHELLRLNNAAAPVKHNVRGGLAGWQEKKVAQYIEEHLSEDVPLPALAELVGLSPYHFARAFMHQFGLPPHRYPTSRRIEKAKGSAGEVQVPVTQIGPGSGLQRSELVHERISRKHAGPKSDRVPTQPMTFGAQASPRRSRKPFIRSADRARLSGWADWQRLTSHGCFEHKPGHGDAGLVLQVVCISMTRNR